MLSELPKNRNLTVEDISWFEDELKEKDWDDLAKNYELSEDVIYHFEGNWDLSLISKHQTLSEGFMYDLRDDLDWYYISLYQNLSEYFIERMVDYVNWIGISIGQKLSESFIKKYKDKVHWPSIFQYQKISEKFKADIDDKKLFFPVAEYDSALDTHKHKMEVIRLMNIVIQQLLFKAVDHDNSKLEEPEKSIFDEYTPKLKSTAYGSDEYKEYLKGMGEGLQHHYEYNNHHPECWKNGIKNMSLIELIEMLVDWLASTRRVANGDIRKSIEMNQKRFGYGDELKQILLNTVNYYLDMQNVPLDSPEKL